MFLRGDQVIYIPAHAHNDPQHKDCELGFVTSGGPDFYFVRYFRRGSDELRTKANSERTPACALQAYIHHRLEVIERLLAEYC